MPALKPRQIAVDQPWRGLGCAGAEIALLQQDHAQAAAGGVARDADAVQPAANDRKIVIRHAQRLLERTEVHYSIAFSNDVDTVRVKKTRQQKR
jgi:hypothetical protein